MLQRYLINFALIFLFAFAQTGVVAHEISHLSNTDQHSPQHSKSKSTVAEQCAQCLSYAKVASGLQPTSFSLPVVQAQSTAAVSYFSNFKSTLSHAYGARAPPQTISL